PASINERPGVLIIQRDGPPKEFQAGMLGGLRAGALPGLVRGALLRHLEGSEGDEFFAHDESPGSLRIQAHSLYRQRTLGMNHARPRNAVLLLRIFFLDSQCGLLSST